MNKLKKIVVQAIKKSAKGIYDLSAKNAMENENFFRDYLKDNIYGFTFTSDSSHTGRKPYEWDVLFYPSDNLLANTKFIIKEKNEDYEIRYYSDGPTNDGTILMITFHDINLPILNKVVKYVNRDLPELIEQNKKEKTGKMAKIISKEILKSAKVSKKAKDGEYISTIKIVEDLKDKHPKASEWFNYDKGSVINYDGVIYIETGSMHTVPSYVKKAIKEWALEHGYKFNEFEGWKGLSSFDKKTKKMTKKAFYEDEKAALAKYLNINENDITKNEDSFHFGIPEFTTKSGEQYSVSASESAIKDAVAENMENLFDELGFEEFKEKVLPHVGGFENNFSVSESHFYDEVYRELEEDGIEEPTDEQIEKRQQEIIDNYGSAEEFFIEFGDEYVKQMIDHGDAYMNFETMAENVISEYGAGHELASYDNDTNEIEYNGKTYYIFRQQ